MNNKNNNNIKKTLFKDIYGEQKGVLELNLSNFIYNKDNKKLYINHDYFIDKKGLIIFYTPWCKHCKKISSLIINLALSNINLFYFGAVNTENLKDGNDYLAVYANVTKFPTIKIIDSDGSLIDYKYQYTPDNLLYYINTNI